MIELRLGDQLVPTWIAGMNGCSSMRIEYKKQLVQVSGLIQSSVEQRTSVKPNEELQELLQRVSANHHREAVCFLPFGSQEAASA